MATPVPIEPTPPVAQAAEETTPQTEPAPAPAPEPWTPEKALEWNRYYDRYVAAGAILLAFLVSAHKVVNSSFWTNLRVGEEIVKSTPLTTDVFSFSREGMPWVNVPWLYQVASHAIYSTGRSFVTADPSIGDQLGAGILVGLNALARALTVWLILGMRRRGPGLWWFALVAAVTFGAIYAPSYSTARGMQLELVPGGMARQAWIDSETWGILFLALELWLLTRAFEGGRPRALYMVIPLFLLWANVDPSFFFGLIALAVVLGSALVAGRAGRGKDKEKEGRGGSPSPIEMGAVLLGSAAIVLLNPSFLGIYPAAAAPFLAIPGVVFGAADGLMGPDQVAYFGRESFSFYANGADAGAPMLRLGFYGVVVLLGLSSFALNRRRFSPGRLLLYVVAALLWGGMSRLAGEFATVFACVVALNGQEWYLDAVGDRGRTSGGWTAWSVGGRAVTILVFFALMARTLTGYGADTERPAFGFGFEPSRFDFEVGDFLRTAKFSGNVMNLTEAEGSMVISRAYPARKTFIDPRRGLPDREVRRDLRDFRRAFTVDLSDQTVLKFKEDVDQWKKILDKYGATAVLLSPFENMNVFRAMATSPNWIWVRDDGRDVLFGRADAPKEDLAFFQQNKHDATEMVYRRPQTLPFPDRAPSAMTFIDRIVRNRALTPEEPHVEAAKRWLGIDNPAVSEGRVDAAQCIMAIRELRIALYHNPDESLAYALLDSAYSLLEATESIPMQGKSPAVPREYLEFRSRQRVTALNYAIQTTPPPRDEAERQALAELYGRLALLHRRNNELDLERDALVAARDLVGTAALNIDELKRIDNLDDAIQRFKDQIQEMIAQSIDPIRRARQANSVGFPGLALHELEEAEAQGVPLDQFLPDLVDLYCRTGQPDKANVLISSRQMNDPALSTGAGTTPYRIGLVDLLLGFYPITVEAWGQSISQVRSAIADKGLSTARDFSIGQFPMGVRSVLELTGLPNQPGLIEIEAEWECQLALCQLESGQPKEAGQHFLKALELNSQIATRALIEDYLKRLGVPLPKAKDAPAEEPKPAAEKPAEPAKAESKP